MLWGVGVREGGGEGWGGGHTAWCTPSFPCHPPVTSSPYPCHSLPLPMPAPHHCVLSLQDSTCLKEEEVTWAATTSSSHVWHAETLPSSTIEASKLAPPAQLVVFFGGFPLPPLLLIVKMRSLIAGWVKSPVISAGNHPLIERYHKSLPRAWFLLCLLGDSFVSWRSPPMGPQLTLLSVAEIRRVVLGDTHPHAWPKYRFKAVSSVRRNSWRMLWGVFVFCCTINAPDLIEEDAHIRHFPICKRGQVHSRG